MYTHRCTHVCMPHSINNQTFKKKFKANFFFFLKKNKYYSCMVLFLDLLIYFMNLLLWHHPHTTQTWLLCFVVSFETPKHKSFNFLLLQCYFGCSCSWNFCMNLGTIIWYRKIQIIKLLDTCRKSSWKDTKFLACSISLIIALPGVSSILDGKRWEESQGTFAPGYLGWEMVDSQWLYFEDWG